MAFYELTPEDRDEAAAVLLDPAVLHPMCLYADERTVDMWLEQTIERYRQDGFGHWGVRSKADGSLAGLIGPVMRARSGWRQVTLGYVISSALWRRGYGLEGAWATLWWVFAHTDCPEVVAEIGRDNLASCRLAERLGMHVRGEYMRGCSGGQRPVKHCLYAVARDEVLARGREYVFPEQKGAGEEPVICRWN